MNRTDAELVEGIQITTRSEEEINESVGNTSKKQEREARRNDKSYSTIEEKSDYDIYNPEGFETFSLNISTDTLKVGGAYPINISTNDDCVCNIPSPNDIIFESSDISKAYVRDGVVYAVGKTAIVGDEGYEGNENETVEIKGTYYTKDEDGFLIANVAWLTDLIVVE